MSDLTFLIIQQRKKIQWTANYFFSKLQNTGFNKSENEWTADIHGVYTEWVINRMENM